MNTIKFSLFVKKRRIAVKIGGFKKFFLPRTFPDFFEIRRRIFFEKFFFRRPVTHQIMAQAGLKRVFRYRKGSHTVNSPREIIDQQALFGFANGRCRRSFLNSNGDFWVSGIPILDFQKLQFGPFKIPTFQIRFAKSFPKRQILRILLN